MTAATLPDAGLTDFGNSMKMAGDTMSIFSSEDQLRTLSKENMDQIKKTMTQHEEQFREQVQALHKLYIVQKSVMQEVRKMFQCSSQQLASSSINEDARPDRLNVSIVEGKHSNEAYSSAKDHTEESCVLPTNPHSSVKEFTGSSSERSFCSEIKEVKISANACNEQRKTFDLERPPEEYMDDSDYQIESNNFDILCSNTCMAGNQNMVEDSLMRCNHQMSGYPSLKQKDKRPDNGTPSEPSQESHWDCSQVSEGRNRAAFVKCTSGSQRPQDALNDNMQDFSWDRQPAVAIGFSTTNPSVDSHVGKPLWLLQQEVPSTTEKSFCAFKSDFFGSEELNLEIKNAEQLKSQFPRNAGHTDSTQQYSSLESSGKTAVPRLAVEKQLQEDLGKCFPTPAGSLSANPINCPQPSPDKSIQRKTCSLDMNPPARDTNSCSGALTYQTGDNNENANRSDHGSNSPAYGFEAKFRDKDFSTVTGNYEKCTSDSQQVESGHDKVEEMKSELKEALQTSNNDSNSSATDSNDKQQDAAVLKCTLKCTESEKDREEPDVARESKEEVRSDSTLEEACESIAAKILLSFAPSKSQSDSKWQVCEIQTGVDSSRSVQDSMGHIHKQNRRTRRALNYSNGVGMDEAVKWTKSVCGRRRRTSRRQ